MLAYSSYDTLSAPHPFSDSSHVQPKRRDGLELTTIQSEVFRYVQLLSQVRVPVRMYTAEPYKRGVVAVERAR